MRSVRLVVLGVLVCSVPAKEWPKPTGRVVDLVTGQGIPGVEITSVPIASGAQTVHLVSDQDGMFPFPAGTISCRKEGYREVQVVGGPGLRVCCQLDRDIYDRPIEGPFYYRMMPLGKISGMLVDRTGQIVANGSLWAERSGANLERDYEYESPRLITTDGMGRFHVQLDAMDTDFFMTDEACGRSLRAHIRVRPGVNDDIRITTPSNRLHTVAGSVVNFGPHFDLDEVVVAVRAAEAVPGCLAHPPTFLTSSGGKFAFGGLPQGGKYILTARVQPKCSDDVGCGGPRATVSQIVTVGMNDLGNVGIEVHPGLEVTVVTHLDGNRPNPGWIPNLYLADEAGEPEGVNSGVTASFAGSGDGGRIISQLQPGRHSLKIQYPYRTKVPSLREVRLNGEVVPPDSIPLADRSDGNRLDAYFSDQAGHLSVYAVDQSGYPLRRYTPIIFQHKEGPFELLGVGSQGMALEPGEYFVFVVTPDLPVVAIRPQILSGYVSWATPVSLKAGQDLKLELKAAEIYPLAPAQRR